MPINAKEISQVKSVSEFLTIVVKQYKGHRLSYSELGRLCGLKSRSHPREIVLGKKKVSLETARQISRSLKLSTPFKDLLLMLAELELAKDKATRSFLKKELEKARNQILKRLSSESRNSSDFFLTFRGQPRLCLPRIWRQGSGST